MLAEEHSRHEKSALMRMLTPGTSHGNPASLDLDSDALRDGHGPRNDGKAWHCSLPSSGNCPLLTPRFSGELGKGSKDGAPDCFEMLSDFQSVSSTRMAAGKPKGTAGDLSQMGDSDTSCRALSLAGTWLEAGCGFMLRRSITALAEVRKFIDDFRAVWLLMRNRAIHRSERSFSTCLVVLRH